MTLSAMNVAKSVKWPKVIAALDGWPAAQVVRAARDAAKLAVLEGREAVEQKDLERAVQALQPVSHGQT